MWQQRSALPNGLFHPKSCFRLERRPDIGIRCRWLPEVGGGDTCVGRRVPVPSCLFSFSLPVSAPLLLPLSPSSVSPLLPDICFFPNVAVRCRPTANEIRSLFLRPGSYFRSTPPATHFCRPLRSFSLRVNEFRNFASINIERAERRPSVPRSHEWECPRRRTDESRYVSGNRRNGACLFNGIHDSQKRTDIGATR